MADFYGTTFTAAKTGTPPRAFPDGARAAAKQRATIESINTGTAPPQVGDRIYLGKLPEGAIYQGVRLTANQTLGTAQLAIGITGTPAKYRAAATFTAVDTPTMFGTAATKAQGPLAAAEDIWATVSVAAIPNNTILVSELLFTTDA
jgi:hypothetical protein